MSLLWVPPAMVTYKVMKKQTELEKKLQKQLQKILKMLTLKIKSKIFSHLKETNNGKNPIITITITKLN